MNFLYLFIVSLMLIANPSAAFAQTSETELLSAAQQAFNDGFNDVASRYLQDFLRQHPQSPHAQEAKLLLGQCDFMLGSYAQALELFNELSHKNNNRDQVLFWRAETYLKQNRLDLAQNDYKALIHDYPKSMLAPQAYYSLGWSFFEEKKFDEAKTIFLKLVNQFPGSQLLEDVTLKIADCDYNAGRLKQAIEGFKQWTARFPQSPHVCEVGLNIANGFYDQQQLEPALSYYQKVVAANCDNTLKLSAYVSEVWDFIKLKKFKDAHHILKKAQEFGKTHRLNFQDGALASANLAYEEGLTQEALRIFSDFIVSWPHSDHLAQGYLGRANVYYLLGKYKEAQEDYRHLLQSNSGYGGWHQTPEMAMKVQFGLGWCEFRMGRLPQALAYFQKVFDTTSDADVKANSLIQMGDVNGEGGQWQEAADDYERLKKNFPGVNFMDYVLYRQAISFLKLGNWQGALLDLNRLKTDFPHSPYGEDLDYYNGIISFKKNDWRQSAGSMERFLKNLTHPSAFSPEANYILALSYLNLNQYEEALRVFEKILRLYPNKTEIAQNADIGIAKCEFKTGQYKEAIKRFKLIVFKYPKTDGEFEALLWLAQYYIKNANIDAAISFYKSMIEEFPDSPRLDEIHYELGQAYEIQGISDKALEEYKAIVSKDAYLRVKSNLAIAGILSKDLDSQKGIAAYESIIATSPDFAGEAYLKLGQLYRNIQDYAKELGVYQEALGLAKADINRAQLQFNIADTLELMNRTQEAIAEYLKIPLLYPKTQVWGVKAYLRVAKIYEEGKDWQGAKVTYQKIIQLNTPEAAFAQERLDWIKNNAWKMRDL